MIDTLLPFLMFGILLAAVLARPLARQRWVSLPVILVLAGFVSSEAWVALGRDTGLRWQILRDLVFYLLVPILIFEAAVTIRVRRLREEALLIGALAIPLLVVAALAAAAIIHVFMGETLSGNWVVALLIGAMICATDPARRTGMRTGPGGAANPCRARDILEGESMLNDATTISLFAVVSGLLLMPGTEVSLAAALGQFLLALVGGAALGVALGWLFDLVIDPANDKIVATASTLVLAFASFWIGDHLLGLSGVMTTLGAGLTIAWRQRRQRREEDIAFAIDSWRVLGFLANAMLFFLVGMSFTVGMFEEHWMAMVIGILAALLSRALIVFAGAGPLSWLPRISALRWAGPGPLSFSDQRIVFWGGTRGAVAIALALSLDLDTPHWYAVQSTVYGVALFSLVVQMPVVGAVERAREEAAGVSGQHRGVEGERQRSGGQQ
jgi:CPA1 family monovalent cation:H+ antiporter